MRLHAQLEPDLFDRCHARGPATIQERFEEFHELNPEVYRRIVGLARDLKRRGHHRCGIDLLWNVLRWETMLETNDPSSQRRLNDHYRSRYSRMIARQEPDLAGFFELRALQSD